ncbi:MAG: hypothetical protein ACI9N9_000081 [Enterobacterales bacterium]|jgi:hypothetical protein
MSNRFNHTAGEMVATIRGVKHAKEKMLNGWDLSGDRKLELKAGIELCDALLKDFVIDKSIETLKNDKS